MRSVSADRLPGYAATHATHRLGDRKALKGSPKTAASGRILRAALVGCGRISQVHMAALSRLENVALVGVSDTDLDLARRRAAEHGSAGAYANLATMLEEVRPDVVHLLTPPHTHPALVALAARHGAHLYVEKPIASRASDARAMVAAAAEAGVRLCPGHNRLFDPVFLKTLDLVGEGAIGRILSARAEQGFTYEQAARSARIPWSYSYDWGIFENLVPHPLYLVSHFLQDPRAPQVVGFNLDRVPEAAVEELRVLIPSASAVGEVVLSLTSSPEQNRIELTGTAGRIVADLGRLYVLVDRKGPLPSVVHRLTSGLWAASQLTGAALRNLGGILTGRVVRYPGIHNLLAAFYRSLREGSPPPVLPEDGLRTVEQMDAIREACRPFAKVRHTSRTAVPSPSILVTGATGFLGTRLVERLVSDGTSLRACTRLVSRAKPLPGTEWVSFDLADPASARAALTGIETVYHCAAMVGRPSTLDEYRTTNVRGTLELVAAAAEAGVGTFVYLSSIGVYASPEGGRRYLDESTAYEARPEDRGAYTQTKLEAERALLDHARANARPRILVLRPGTIYGPGSPLPLGRFPLLASEKRPMVAGGRGVPVPLVYVDNVVDAMMAAVRSQAASGAVVHLVDDSDLDQGALAEIVSRATGGRVSIRFVPYPIVWSMMLGVDLVARVRQGKAGTARYRLQRTLAEMRFDTSRARQLLGWAPAVSVHEGIPRVVESLRERPYPH